MKLIIRLALTLCLITAVAGFGLGLIHGATKDKIAEAEAKKTAQGLSAVLPGYEVDPSAKQEIEGIPYWVGQNSAGDEAVAFIATKTGYSSDIQTMVGIDREGSILGISVLFQQETPGLGARVQEVPSSVSLWQKITGQTPEDTGPVTPWFADQFKGLKAESIAVQKGAEWQAMSESERKSLHDLNAVSSLSGATITTRAISQSIEEAAAVILGDLQTKSGGSVNPS